MEKSNSGRREGYDNKKYAENHEKIFGPPKRGGGKMVFSHGHTKKEGPQIIKSIEPFKSPVDGSIISDHAQLREHNRRHGVTDSRDYSADFVHKRRLDREARLTGSSKDDIIDRKRALARAIDRHM